MGVSTTAVGYSTMPQRSSKCTTWQGRCMPCVINSLADISSALCRCLAARGAPSLCWEQSGAMHMVKLGKAAIHQPCLKRLLITSSALCRYLAVRSNFPVPGMGLNTAGVLERSPLEKQPVQPASLRKVPLYATPISRRNLMMAGRGKQALQEGQAWQSKVCPPLPSPSPAPSLFQPLCCCRDCLNFVQHCSH